MRGYEDSPRSTEITVSIQLPFGKRAFSLQKLTYEADVAECSYANKLIKKNKKYFRHEANQFKQITITQILLVIFG